MPWVFSHLRGLDSWDKQPPPSPPPPPPPVRGKVREGSGRFGKVAREGYHPYHLCQGYHPYHLCQGWCSTRSLVRGRPVRGCRELGPAELPLRRDLPFRQIQGRQGMTTLLLYRDDLAPGRCETPGCDHAHDDELVLNARCHPRAGVEVTYHKAAGIAELRCKRCGKDIAALQVASRADPRAGYGFEETQRR